MFDGLWDEKAEAVSHNITIRPWLLCWRHTFINDSLQWTNGLWDIPLEAECLTNFHLAWGGVYGAITDWDKQRVRFWLVL